MENKKDILFITFLKNLRFLMIISAIIFISGIIVGYLYTDISIHKVERLSNVDSSLFFDYFKNNFLLGFINIIGMISFGLVSIYLLFLNGVILGGAIKISSNYTVHFGQIMLLILPHGVIEFIAIIISGALGFIFIRNAILIFRNQRRRLLNKQDLKDIFTGLLLILFLFFIAAIIEYYITPDITDFINYKNS